MLQLDHWADRYKPILIGRNSSIQSLHRESGAKDLQIFVGGPGPPGQKNLHRGVIAYVWSIPESAFRFRSIIFTPPLILSSRWL